MAGFRRSSRGGFLAASALMLTAAFGLAAGAARAAEQKGFLETIHKHVTLTSTRAGERRPEPLRHRRRARLRRNDPERTTCWSTISTTSTTSRASARRSSTTTRAPGRCRCSPQIPRKLAECPGGVGLTHRHDHAENRLGDRRQHAEQRRHHRHQGPGLPASCSTPRARSPAPRPGRTSTAPGATWR